MVELDEGRIRLLARERPNVIEAGGSGSSPEEVPEGALRVVAALAVASGESAVCSPRGESD